MLGCTADELVARLILDFIPEEERAGQRPTSSAQP
jgi:hypothetical protein